MSRIDELVERLCPEGVEYRALGEVFDTRNGYTPSKRKPEYWQNGTVPWFRMEDIRENGRVLDTALQQVNRCALKQGGAFPANSLIVATSATIGEHALITVDFLCNQRFTCLMLKEEYKERLNMRFLFHYCFVLDEWCKANTHNSSFASVDMQGFAKFRIPVPPMEVQEEVVRVLDSFAELEAELEAELAARRRQYAYYRDQLLDFTEGEDVPWLTLGEVGEIRSGLSGKSKSDFNGGNARYLPYTSVFNNIAVDFGDALPVRIGDGEKQNALRRGDVVFTASSETPLEAGMTSVVTQDPEFTCYLNSFCFIYRPDSDLMLLPDFSKFLFRSGEMRRQITRCANGVTRFNLSKASILKIRVPLPPLAEQQRIVDILDRFDALTASLTEGLPAEIEARRAQYAHYRDRLLAFPEKPAA